MRAWVRPILLVLASGCLLPAPVSADSPPDIWGSDAGNWEGMILVRRGDDSSLMPAVMRIRYDAGTLDLPRMGCKKPVKRVDEPPAPWGAGPIYVVDSTDGMCGIAVSVRIRGEQAEVLAESEGAVRPIGVLFHHWNGREWLEELVAGYRPSYRPDPSQTRFERFDITQLVQSMSWKPVIPDEAYAHLAAGNAAMSAEGAGEASFLAAERSYLEAHRLAPWWPDPLYNLALTYEALGLSAQSETAFDDYLTALGVKPSDYLTTDGLPTYYELKRIFEVEVTEPAPSREEYEAWAREMVAYMESTAKQEAALARASEEYDDAVEDFTGDGCTANTSSGSFWRECHARHLELGEWSEHVNEMSAEVDKANAFIEEWVDEGFRAQKAGEYEKAIKVIRPLADGGDMNAQYLLGHMYLHGQGVPASESDAVEWLKKAVANGSKGARKALDELSNP